MNEGEPRRIEQQAGNGSVQVGGHVQGDVVVNLPAPGPDEAALERGYLQWLCAQCRPLSLASIDYSSDDPTAPRLGLEQVYTALLTTLRSYGQPPDDTSAGLREPGAFRLVSAVAVLNDFPRTVLLGAPGSGKSSLLNFMVLCLAGERLGDSSANLSILTASLPKADGSDGEEPQPWTHGALVPVRVILRDLAAGPHLPANGEPGAEVLWGQIQDDLQRADKADYLPYLRERMRAGQAMLLLDGLDEVAEAEHRRGQVLAAIRAFAEAHGDARILVTVRPYAYQQPKWQLEYFFPIPLADFSDGQVRRFIRRWYAAQGADAADNAGRARLLEQAIFHRDKGRLLELARRPLLLTLMARLHAEKRRELPDKRAELYSEVLDLLLRNWDARRFKVDAQGCPREDQPALTEYLDVGPERIRAALERLAYLAHRDQAEPRDTADIAEADLVDALLAIDASNRDIRPRQLVHYLEHRSGVLTQRAPGVYTFPHRSFQEYLAACHLTSEDLDLDAEPGDHGDASELIAVLGRTDPDRWREVVLLAAGAHPTLAWDIAEQLLPDLDDGVDLDTPDAWGARLAGQVLLESTEPAKAKGRRVRVRDRIRDGQLAVMRRSKLAAPERAGAGDCLGVLGDPRFDPDHWYLPADPTFGFVHVPAGAFLMGSDKAKDADASDDELPQHELWLPDFWIGRWPVTVAQFRIFAQETGRAVNSDALSDALSAGMGHPVTLESWHDALAYSQWLGELMQAEAADRADQAGDEPTRAFWQAVAEGRLRASLPSEAEWEKAARGADGRIFPWGDNMDCDRANAGASGVGNICPVGCFPEGASVFGCEDQVGGVQQRTRSLWGHDHTKPSYFYPYSPDDGRECLDAECGAYRVGRGGTYIDNFADCRVAARKLDQPRVGWSFVGFRVVWCAALCPPKPQV